MLGDLGAWLALAIIAVLIWKQGGHLLAPIVRPAWSLVRWCYDQAAPLVAGALVTSVQPSSTPVASPVTALESGVTESDRVTTVTNSDLEIAWIAYELGRGTTPSATAKTLPGYSPRDYKSAASKVGLVEALLAEKRAAEQERAESKTAKTSAKRQEAAILHEQSI